MADRALNRVLIVAFQFPPAGGSSGVQRALKFAKYLPDFGWEPLILTVTPGAYPVVRVEPADSGLPEGLVVRRGWAADAGRLLRIRGRYPSWSNLPDRWSSWWLTAVPIGLSMVRKYKPRAIFSTFPIATAHLVGGSLARASRLPWIADFRDPMVENAYPRGRLRRNILRKLERQTIERTASVVFVTQGLREMYARRYPHIDDRKWKIIPNGYDEEDFNRLRAIPQASNANSSDKVIRIVHSGIIYANERDPTYFFEALGKLVKSGELKSGEVEIVLRGSRNEEMCRRMIDANRLAGIIRLEPVSSYSEALKEMQEAEGLLLLQGANCNRQIPAKLYEYLRMQKPVLALSDPRGDTGRLLLKHGINNVAPLEDSDAIAKAIVEFLSCVKTGNTPIVAESELRQYSRREGARGLARLLEEVAG